MKFEDLTNKKFNKLTVLKRDYSKSRTAWLCICDCGNECIVTSDCLKSGRIKSCGCLNHKLKHGLKKRNSVQNRMLRILVTIKQRCNNPKCDSYPRYGGKGIKVCSEWNEKENGSVNFIKWCLENGYSEKLSIDRIDNSKGYSPENCRWVDKETQTLNRDLKAKGKSGYVGVRQCKNGKWYSGITFKNEYIHLGTFNNLEEAAEIRKKAENKYFKSYMGGI